ncbi:MAG: aconitase X catalytic domain-containing protein [Gemmatimonadetes bacterium]|nr:aconitase X catalytic domain-containing protein [Gemmatimonadota bacterium]
MSALSLEPDEIAAHQGRRGEAVRLAMRIVVRMAELAGADRLIPIAGAHIDSCLFHGRAGLDFAERLAQAGARVAVPATLNVSSLDLLHPGLFRGDAETATLARRQMDAYVAMGCRPTWTCAPYQLPERPRRGEHIAWAESNAIVFANSVLGARTDRYGDFIDICAAITGRVPLAGLHRDADRRGDVVFDCGALPVRVLECDAFYPVLGHLVGREVGRAVPVLSGLPAGLSEDRLKAIGAAAAASGAVAMFHAVGSTPEAPALDDALHGRPATGTTAVTMPMVRAARDELSTKHHGPLVAISLGTPHYSIAEFARLMPLLDGVRFASGIDAWVSTGRATLAELERRGWAERLRAAGVTLVVDTCTYITPILRHSSGTVMTDSAKWAWYAPGNLGVDVAFGTLEECIDSAKLGRISRDERLWADA